MKIRSLDSHIEICFKTRKSIYSTLKNAKTVLNRNKKLRGKEAAQRVFKCDYCDGYHLTSLSIEEQKEIENKVDIPILFPDRWKDILNNE